MDEATENELLREFGSLWEEADAIWEPRRHEPAFGAYVSSNYLDVYYELKRCLAYSDNLLEWGSGLGVVTIMASRMGFEASGIEAEGELVELSLGLAEKYGPDSIFAEGSFIPDEFEWNPAAGEVVDGTTIDAPAAYDALGQSLDEFGLVYAYPWPEEHSLYRNIMQQCGRPDAILLMYDGREGMQISGG